MASKQTENYGLSQWEATDQVVRLDFNSDNAKIDRALHGIEQNHAADMALLRTENMWEKISEVILEADSNPVTLTIPNPERFQEIQMHISTSGCDDLSLALNDGESIYIIGEDNPVKEVCLYEYGRQMSCGFIHFLQGGGPATLFGHGDGMIYNGYSVRGFSFKFISNSVSLSGLNKVVLSTVSGALSAGSRFVLYGRKI